MSGTLPRLALGTALALTVALLLGWGYGQGGEAPGGAAGAARHAGGGGALLPSPFAAAGGGLDASRPAGLAALGPQSGAVRSPAEVERRIFEQGSLRGAALDGDWGTYDASGRLLPSLALRRRFDQLLTTLGEVRVDELSGWLRARLEQELSPAHARAVLELWQRYLRLADWPFQTALHGSPQADADALRAALAERQQVRRQLLGAEWAAAWFADDEAALAAAIARIGQPQPAVAAPAADAAAHAWLAPPPGVAADELQRQRTARYGAEAAARLAAEDAEQARWQQRLAAVREQWDALQRAAELSPAQRMQAIERTLAQQFDAREALRVRALLGI
jgi:lipase chaperone LimK